MSGAHAQDKGREVLLGVIGKAGSQIVESPPAPVAPRSTEATDTGLQLDLARDRIAARDFTRATSVLEKIIARNPDGPDAPEARSLLREIAETRAAEGAGERPHIAAVPAPPPPTGGDPTQRMTSLESSRLDDQFRSSVGDRIYFDADSANIGVHGGEVLTSQAVWLKSHPRTVASLEGHADDSGDSARNSELALQRAEAVRRRLIEAGVPSDQIRMTGFGRDQRVALCDDEGCRVQNRRVVTVIGLPNREARLSGRRN